MVKEYVKKRKKFIEDFKQGLSNLKSKLPSIVYDNKQNIDSGSWFDINRFKSKKVVNNVKIKTNFPRQVINCVKVKMILNNNQKMILNKWFDSYTDMYNETLTYVRNNCDIFKNEVIRSKLTNDLNLNNLINSYNLRENLIEKRNQIIENSQLASINKNTKIQTHTLDYAIRQFVSNVKSAVTNLIKGNFKRFRIKFWKYNRPSKTIEIEKQYIRDDKLCPYILGDIKYIYNNQVCVLNDINSNVKINYNSITDEYLLLIPNKHKPKEILNKTRNIISLDPGLRTFMTGLTEYECFKIGTNVNTSIKAYVKRLKKIKNNENIPEKVKKKNELMINRKIHNKIDDLHWKTIRFLTLNFKNILLGDMSAKSIVAKNKSVLSKEMKVACLQTRFYEFRQRLAYKCQLTKTNFKLVKENYTSKTCSLCGNYNEKLADEKIYNCNKCKKKIDRDVNGCRNIFMKCMMKL